LVHIKRIMNTQRACLAHPARSRADDCNTTQVSQRAVMEKFVPPSATAAGQRLASKSKIPGFWPKLARSKRAPDPLAVSHRMLGAIRRGRRQLATVVDAHAGSPVGVTRPRRPCCDSLTRSGNDRGTSQATTFQPLQPFGSETGPCFCRRCFARDTRLGQRRHISRVCSPAGVMHCPALRIHRAQRRSLVDPLRPHDSAG